MPAQTLDYLAMPNPMAPEAWIPYPRNLYTMYTAVAMGVLSVLVWDILSSLPDEIRLIFQYKFSWPTLCYCIARIAPLPFLAIQNTQLTQDIDNCHSWSIAGSTFFASIHIPAGLLFLFRVRAVYNGLPRVKWLISTGWVIYAGSCLLPFAGMVGTRVSPLNRCIGAFKKPYPAILFFMQAAYDLIVCVAVTYKISIDIVTEGMEMKRWWSFRIPKSPFTKLRARFLADSHYYFVLTFLLKVAEIIVYFAGNAAVLLIFTQLDNVLISIIACKIHRNFKLGKSGMFNHSYEMSMFDVVNSGGSNQGDTQVTSEDQQAIR
ncbi:hypothetical protein CPB83DRAFT_896678 [Crepidotus variabilis]|uniref:DUF6533 domain-containing protein n=1 Tax=Crepidotus variabilis TaxID=179855 RepID=A0A9P6EBA9_9AGAR|nr:hypothetical protein CPB83DRAFT_896678 [Crepidotus variabilis]